MNQLNLFDRTPESGRDRTTPTKSTPCAPPAQRVSFMLKNIERGDNKQRVNEALRKLAALIQKETDPE